MYPQIIIDSYWLMLVLGVLSAIFVFRFLSTKTKLPDKAYDYYAFAAVASIAAGLVFAMLFQSFYNFAETGVFKLQGLTFMGGLIGGAATFIAFALSTKNGMIRKCFFPVAEIAVPCICVAHCLGRIGCFLAGCCYGVESEFGIFFPTLGKTVIPTQLIEAIFLALLFALLLFFTLKNNLKGFNLPFYCIGYAIFRFIIEFFRADPRGAFLGFLSPSQVQSIVFLLIGIALLVLRIKKPSLYEMPQEEKE
ncbi:MAG: prolipoprotein diacylglyceryl transferase [Clostridia bacterium]|nr:prolipoprotein diacylglyceryl transferase [Clostridia bacterium]